MTVDLTTFTGSIKSASSHSFQIDIPEASGTRVYAFVYGGKAASGSTDFDISTVTLNGSSMTQLVSRAKTTVNRTYKGYLYEAIDPLNGGANPTTQMITAKFDRGISAIGIVVFVASGVIDRGDADFDSLNPGNTSITVSATTDQFPGRILGSGFTRMRTSGANTNYDDLAYTDDVTEELEKISTGNTDFIDMVIWGGYAEAASIGTYDLTWGWPVTDIALQIIVPLYGASDYAEIEVEAVEPTVVYGTATLDDITVEAEFSGDDPEVVLGSIPPVQVIGRGTLFISTASRNITVLLLATTDDLWTVADNADAVEDLGLTVSRRKGYLTPM